MKRYLYTTLASFILIVSFSNSAMAQLNANFTANIQQGCSPLVVNFSNQSSGNIVDYLWKFGNGNSSDTVAPIASYISPGTYDVTLIVYGSGGQVDSIVKQNFITVFGKPTANFSASRTTVCIGNSISFTDNSVRGSGQIVSWQWDFGDGGSSTQQNPTYTYQGLGTYTVSLQVTDVNGCSHFFFIDNYINITNAPNANFNGTSTAGCVPPHEVTFNDNSTGTPPFTYEWDFGDGGSSTQQNPTHSYNNVGNYNVKLVVTDQSGCSDSITRTSFVNIDQPVAAMSVNTNYGCSSPATFFQFSNLSTGPTSFVRWDFGDNNIVNAQNPTHAYFSPGVYTVALISGNNTCKDTVTETIYVQQLSADFSMDKDLSCDVPLDINFTDQSNNAISWNWSFGDATTSNAQNPSHSYNNEGAYYIELSITDTLGCVSSHRDTAVVDIPELQIDTIIGNYCIPVDVNFFSQLISTDPALTYSWNFGDGGTSAQGNPIHTYTDTGQYLITLDVLTELGCTVSDSIEIEIGDKPMVFDASFRQDSVCRKEGTKLNIFSDFAEHFEGSVPGDEPQDATIIDSFVNTSNSKGFLYTPIYITPVFHGCKGNEFVFIDTVKLYGPFCDQIIPNFNCNDTYTVNFGHVSNSYQLTYWEFGDGGTSDDHYPTHTYSNRGVYNVTLYLTDTITGCSFVKEKEVTIAEPIAVSTISDSTGCQPLNLITDASLSQDAEAYFWISNQASLNHLGAGPDTFNTPQGNYSLSLIVADVNGCTDTSNHNIEVYGHDNLINMSSTIGCVPVTLDVDADVFADTTVKSYLWNINGTTFTDSTASYQFTNSGNFSISLTTVDDYGCRKISTKQFTATDPQADFIPNKQIACIGENVIFVNTSRPSGGLTYYWDFGDGNTSSQRVPTHQYTYNDTFTVSLIVEDIFGCSDTTVKQNIVMTSSPTADFAVSDTFAPCPPLFVNFTDQSSDDVVSWNWNFGDNSGSVLEAPGHSYNRPGNFDVRLIVSNSVGCKDTSFVSDLIKVGGPTGNFIVNPPEGCKPLTSRFYITNANDVSQITWDFGDGLTAIGDSAAHTYTSSGVYYPNVILLNSNNCSFSYERIDTVIVDTLIADFIPSDYEVCVPVNFNVQENSKGSVVDWTWKIENDSFSGQNLPTQAFTTPGDYQVKLIVENSRGCLDSISKTITVHPLPFVEISGDTFFCENATEQLFATEDSNYSYQWVPTTGLDDPNVSSPYSSLNTSTTYRVVVTDQNGCIDTSDAHHVIVFPELELNITSDTTIVMGDTAQLRPTSNQPVTNVSWTPTNDLTCATCFSPDAYPLEQTSYTITASDTIGCYEKSATIVIEVIDDIKIAMPEIFTPNSDDINDLLFVRGWNIKELVYFRIFNRWGELVFETDDLNEGWDGTYKGKDQNMDSYAYVIKAISHKDREGEARGSFSLVR